MTNVDELEGRELDAAVAVEVLGWIQAHHKSPSTGYITNLIFHPEVELEDDEHEGWHEQADRSLLNNAPALSDESAREWPAVLDVMEEQGWAWSLHGFPDPPYDMKFWWPDDPYRHWAAAEADTRAEAVLRAALRAVREGGGDG